MAFTIPLTILFVLTCVTVIGVELIWLGTMRSALGRVREAESRFEQATLTVTDIAGDMIAEIADSKKARGAR